ncbi:helix-turn-helix domain-containing protein [Paenactinomyces guangxiensis]|uniref:Helix-turn-helix transcriptional regulator n=1 Tax=Paenactinomyces guangxiensis TaxID=1490290 RepID=A0A7W1WQ20_9BACL|nr:AraC family transcriptional regulator [Paenactinomyces guangxiensis]MBA4493829.1 helix-turn-helix transcriptional regulator [Paenactinomyces guangxiensis]MBH8591295.1 helix-turn-helix transcriptional regulator [Paenactinomyces guangxiensis]
MEHVRLLEDRLHGDSMFPLKVYTVDHLDGEVIFHYHWHPEMELIYMEEGTASLQMGTSLITLKAGEAIFIPSGQLHAAYPVEKTPFRLHAIVFHANLINSFTYDTIQTRYIDLISGPHPFFPIIIHENIQWMENVLKSIQMIIQQFQRKEPVFELTIKAHLLMLVSEIIKNTRSEDKPKNPHDSVKINRIKQVLQYIEQHYSEKISIRELARIIQMSEGHFSRFFKSVVRMTPVEYMNTLRINRAAKLLRETDRRIIDISMDVGFDNPSYFIKIFKQQKKCTPSQFRKSV